MKVSSESKSLETPFARAEGVGKPVLLDFSLEMVHHGEPPTRFSE